MKRLAYLTAMALLGIGLTLAQNTQNTKPSSDPSNSSNNANQAQSATSQTGDNSATAPGANRRHKQKPSQSAVPDPTVRDQQSSTNSANDASGQKSNQASPSTMGTTGSTPAPEEKQPATIPQNGTSPDQQPNSTTGPDTATPRAQLLPTPAARAAATHTPDPGTCMNPAAMEVSADGSQAVAPPCR
jgi:hypothetical protein